MFSTHWLTFRLTLNLPQRVELLMANRWHVMRDDGLALGTFDDRDEAEEAAADYARDEADFLEEWRSVFRGSHAKSQAGKIYTIRRVQE
ncbi:MAG TPA: hypothetical protein VF006_02195 [Longimicrobium sp.]